MSRAHWAPFAKASRRRKAGEMNKTEAAYAQYLEAEKVAGRVLWFVYEGLTFKLAKECRYTPDFIVMLPSGEIECHETKGHWTASAKVKIRMAAELFPFRFIAKKKEAKCRGGGWIAEEF